MSILEVFLLGLLQGILEWLPVSSSGQAALFYSRILGLDPLIGFKLGLAAHFGTGLSSIIYFRREFLSIFNERIWMKIILIPTLSAVPIAYILYNFIEYIQPKHIEPVTGVFLIITGAILYSIGVKGEKSIKDIKDIHLVLVGLVEGFSILPGLSRSALTIAALSLTGLDGKDLVKASFIMAVPVTILAGIYQLIFTDVNAIGNLFPMIILLLTSFVSGIFSIKIIYSLAGKLRHQIGILLLVLGGIILALYLPTVVI